jgi:ATP-dependent Clp protease adapter protein ClpS
MLNISIFGLTTMKIKEIVKEAGEDTVIDRPLVHQRQEVPQHIPGGSTVMILNDDYTPFEVVIEAIMAGTHLPAAEAIRRMESAHQNGWAAIASYGSKDMADTVADRIMMHARANTDYDHYRQHPHFRNFQGPWPLQAEVMDADQT